MMVPTYEREALFMKLQGIDISSHQTNQIDFKKVKNAGVSFVIVRAGFGTMPSGSFAPQVTGALAAGLDVGAYWYSYAVNLTQASNEAEAFLATVRPYKGKMTYPLWFDQEYEPGILALSSAMRTDICIAVLEKLENDGWYAGLYSSADWLNTKVEIKRLEAYDKWLAQYASKVQYGGAHGIWQYTGEGKIDGVPTPVDLNWGYKDYPKIIRGAGLNGFLKPKRP